MTRSFSSPGPVADLVIDNGRHDVLIGRFGIQPGEPVITPCALQAVQHGGILGGEVLLIIVRVQESQVDYLFPFMFNNTEYPAFADPHRLARAFGDDQVLNDFPRHGF